MLAHGPAQVLGSARHHRHAFPEHHRYAKAGLAGVVTHQHDCDAHAQQSHLVAFEARVLPDMVGSEALEDVVGPDVVPTLLLIGPTMSGPL